MTLREALSSPPGDVLLAGVLALSITLELVAWLPAPSAAPIVLGALTTLPIALRRRNPLVSFLLVMTGVQLLSARYPGFDNDSMTFVVSFFVALYSLGRHARGLEAWLGGAGVVLAMTLFVRSEAGLAADLGDVAFVIAFAGAPWAAGLTLRLRREREQVLGAENERLRREQEEREARAVAEERSRIARELHDVVSHAISVTVLQARGARRALDGDPVAVRTALDAIEQTNTAALSDMRRLLAVLRDTEPDGLSEPAADHAPLPTLASLESLVERVRGSGLPVEVSVCGDPREVPPGVDLSAYRILQEGLTNVLKHAAAAPTRVTLAYGDDALTVTVDDEGGPMADDPSLSGHGLLGIRERVAVVGGEVDAGPRPDGGGYRLRARLPYSLEVS